MRTPALWTGLAPGRGAGRAVDRRGQVASHRRMQRARDGAPAARRALIDAATGERDWGGGPYSNRGETGIRLGRQLASLSRERSNSLWVSRTGFVFHGQRARRTISSMRFSASAEALGGDPGGGGRAGVSRNCRLPMATDSIVDRGTLIRPANKKGGENRRSSPPGVGGVLLSKLCEPRIRKHHHRAVRQRRSARFMRRATYACGNITAGQGVSS